MIRALWRISTSACTWPKSNPTFFWDHEKSNIWTDCRVIGGLTRVAFFHEKIGGFHAIHQRPRSSKERNIVRVSLYPQGRALLRLAKLINRSALSQGDQGDASSGFFVVVNGVSYWLFFVYRYKKQIVLRNITFLIVCPPLHVSHRVGWFLKGNEFSLCIHK